MEAKRVILWLQASEFEDFAHVMTIPRLFNLFLYSVVVQTTKLKKTNQFYRVEPLNPEIAKPNARFHIIIDLEKS